MLSSLTKTITNYVNQRPYFQWLRVEENDYEITLALTEKNVTKLHFIRHKQLKSLVIFAEKTAAEILK